MENPRKSKIKKIRKCGFRVRMRSRTGRKILSRRRWASRQSKRRSK